ncbi:uncharacterized protein P884DRAFT_2160 [Thermothelomyces heterothallicus CBS 202.75]|uniref:uncharacterized protein n=1 Tax=Thermothelomyces heterothallicus CBS 202.75 TaxID=1149848 RepID=UPI0037434592
MGSTSGQGVHRIALVFCCFVVMGLRRRTGNLLFCASYHGREMNKRFPSAVGTGLVCKAMYSRIRRRRGETEQAMQSGDYSLGIKQRELLTSEAILRGILIES